MTDENKIIETEEKTAENKCKICISEGFKSFLTSALATFVGVFLALSLFGYLHKGPACSPCKMFHKAPPAYVHYKDFKGHKFHKHHGKHKHHKEFKHNGNMPPHKEFKGHKPDKKN